MTTVVGTAGLPLGRKRIAALIAMGFLVAGVTSRIPFRSQILYHWDSVNFALATTHFDIAQGQPHVPGYPVYVALGWLGNLITGDPQVTYVWISILFSGLSASAMYCLGSLMFGRRTGIVAAVFLLTSPLFWFYGEIALPHVVDTFFIIVVVLLLYAAWNGKEWHLFAASVTIAFASGIRPQTAVFLGPLLLLTACRMQLRTVILSGIAAVALAALWAVPLLWLTGGLARYTQLTSQLSQAFGYWEPLEGLIRGDARAFLVGGGKLVSYTAYAMCFALVPPCLWVILRRPLLPGLVRDSRSLFMAMWITPSLSFYALVHMGQQGLVFVFLPSLLLLSATAMVNLLGDQRRRSVYWLALGTVSIAMLNTAIFLGVPEYTPGPVRQKVLTWNTIRNLDAHYLGLVDRVRNEFPADKTVLLGTGWRQPGYYLPEYHFIRLPLAEGRGTNAESSEEGEGCFRISAETSALNLEQGNGFTLLLIDGDTKQLPADLPVRTVPLPEGSPLFAISLDSSQELWWRDGQLHRHPE